MSIMGLLKKKKLTRTIREDIIHGRRDLADVSEFSHVPLAATDYVTAPNSVLVLAFMFGNALDVEVLERTLGAALRRYPYLAGHVEHCVGTCFDESNQQHGHEHGSQYQSSGAMPVPEEERSVVRRHGVDRTSLSSSSSIDRSSSFSHTHDGSMCIVLSKQGVVWVEKESDMELSDVLPVQMKEFSWPPLGIKTEFQLPAMEELYPPLPSPYDTCYNREHLLRVCVTKLADGSMSLVVAVPHVVTDLAPLKGLMKTWSREYSKLYASVKGRQPKNELMSPIVGLMPSIEEFRDVASTVSGEMMDRTRKLLIKKEMSNGVESRKRDERYISYTIESIRGPIVSRNMMNLKRILWKGMYACHLHRSRLDAFKQKAMQDAQADNRLLRGVAPKNPGCFCYLQMSGSGALLGSQRIRGVTAWVPFLLG
eukprot:jgi/Picsp_1/3167/NSC_06007-R1_---NA---